jgi:A/G-specific adenine glycosylase
VQEWCAAEEPELLPRKKPRRKRAELEENCGWVCDRDRILLERQTGKRWRGLWKLPLLENLSTQRVAEDAPLLQITYPFTHHQVTLAVCPAPAPGVLSAEQQWFPRSTDALPAMPSPHRRAAMQMLKRG